MFYVMVDYEQSVAACDTIEEARDVARALRDAEPFMAAWSIADEQGEHVEDVQ